MDKRQKQAWKECDSSGCIYMPRCTHYWGGRCRNLGGKRIPRFRSRRPVEVIRVSSGHSFFMNGLETG